MNKILVTAIAIIIILSIFIVVFLLTKSSTKPPAEFVAYPIRWDAKATSNDITIADNGVVHKNSINNKVSWTFSEKSILETHKYNYKVKVRLYKAEGHQGYVHFCTRNIKATDRGGTEYNAESGTDNSFPSPANTNNWGEGISFMFWPYISTIFTQDNVMVSHIFSSNTHRMYTSSASEDTPWDFTFIISEGKITSILVDVVGNTFLRPSFDILPLITKEELKLPEQSLFIGFSDINNFGPGPGSGFKTSVTIESKTVRNTSPTEPKSLLNSVGDRFISSRATEVNLGGYTSDLPIYDNSYYLPVFIEYGQGLKLTNTSDTAVTIFDRNNADPVLLEQGDQLDVQYSD